MSQQKSRSVKRTNSRKRLSKAKRKRGAAGLRSRNAAPAAVDHKPSPDPIPVEAGEFIPRPVHLRLLSAYETAFQDGKNPTDGVIAAIMQIRRETVNRWRRRNPGLRAWLYGCIGVRAVEMRPLVDRRVTHLALSGSVDHTKLFYQFVAKVGVPRDGATDPSGMASPDDGGACIINILVPHPELPHGGRLPQLPGPSSMSVVPPLEDIPVIAVR